MGITSKSDLSCTTKCDEIIISVIIMNLVTSKARAKHKLLTGLGSMRGTCDQNDIWLMN
jgi:hypothetical protein